jgi:hypothetical protein
VALVEPGPIQTEFGERAVAKLGSLVDPRSPYASVYERADEIKAFADRQMAQPIVVSRAIERALVARRPRSRTVVPFSSQIMVWIAGVRPSRWFDFLLQRLSGLTATQMRLGDKGRPALLQPGR